MGRLIVLEGLDGAGKRTLADRIDSAVTAQGFSVARTAFPRYGEDLHADLVREALYGAHGDLSASVYGMAVLFALDRRAARPTVQAALDEHDVVICDRYVASNAAYGAARLRQDAAGPFVSWVEALEFGRCGVPRPHLQVLVRVPVAVAAQRAESRAASDASRAKDSFESDDGLQARCATVYDELVGLCWASPWSVTDGTDLDTIIDRITERSSDETFG